MLGLNEKGKSIDATFGAEITTKSFLVEFWQTRFIKVQKRTAKRKMVLHSMKLWLD